MNILKNILGLICGDPPKPVDVAALLDGMAETHSEKLDWRHSIVDLLKLLALDSSFEARRELATELGYHEKGRAESSDMNAWLHRQVMQKLRENGGRMPDELR